MTIELERNDIRINSKIQEDNAQNIIEGDIIVPDTKPDVISIIQTDGEVRINSKEIHKDMIVVRGAVDFNILYKSDDPSRAICNIKHSINFDQTIDIQTDESNIKSHVDYKVEHIDGSILNGRKINVKAILDCFAKVSKEYEVSAVSQINRDDVQVLTKTINVAKSVESEDVNSFISWETDIPIGKPAVKEILRTDAYIVDNDVKVAGGKAVVRGNIEVKSLYVPDMNDGSVEFIKSEIPFSEVLDIDGLEDDSELNVSLKINNVNAGLKTDEDGDLRVVDYEFELNFKPTHAQRQVYVVVDDAYSVSSRLEFEKSLLKVSRVVENLKTQSTVKDMVQLSSDGDKFEKIYGISSKVNLTEISTEHDKVLVDGIIDVSITYFTGNEEEPIKRYTHQIPLHNTVEVKGVKQDMDVTVMPQLGKFSYDLINDREIELKNILSLNIEAIAEEDYEVITKIDSVPLDESIKTMQPSMTVYYIQHGDTLWNIAKKYYTTVNELEKVNDINNDETLQVGSQLLIPKMS